MSEKAPERPRNALRHLLGPTVIGVIAALLIGLRHGGFVVPNSGLLLMVVVMGLTITESPLLVAINLVLGLAVTVMLIMRTTDGGQSAEWVRIGVAVMAFVSGTGIVFTLRRRLERALKAPVRSERLLFQAVMTSMHDAIVETDWKGIRDVNDSFCRMTGFTRAELIGKTPPYPFWPAEQYAAIAAALEAAMRGGALDFELILNRKGGERFPVLLSVSRILDGSAPNRVLYSFRDITELKKAQEEARASERMLHHAIEGAQMGVWDWDLVANRISWTGYHERIWGMKSGEFQGSPEQVFNRIHPEDVKGVLAGVAEAAAAKKPYRGEFRVVWPDGSIHWILSTGSHLYDAQGKAVRLSGVNQDITQRREAQGLLVTEGAILKEIATGAALETTLLSLVQMIEGAMPASRCGILTLDEETGLLQLQVAPHMPEEYGELVARLNAEPGTPETRAAFWGRRVVTEDIHAEPRWVSRLDLAMAMRLRSSIAEPILARNGRVLGIFAIYHYERGHGGLVEGQLRVLEDAAQLAAIAMERAREQKELQAARGAMERSHQNAREFLEAVAAELRTPLMPIVALAQAMERDPHLAEMLRGDVQIIRRNADAIAAMLEELNRSADGFKD